VTPVRGPSVHAATARAASTPATARFDKPFIVHTSQIEATSRFGYFSR